MQSASLEWVEVVRDLFLEGAEVARVVGWLDGMPRAGSGYVSVRRMRAIDGFDATLAVEGNRPRSLIVWYRAIEAPTLATAVQLFGLPTLEPRRLFELVFEDATRALDDAHQVLLSCSASNAQLSPAQRRLAGIALTIER